MCVCVRVREGGSIIRVEVVAGWRWWWGGCVRSPLPLCLALFCHFQLGGGGCWSGVGVGGNRGGGWSVQTDLNFKPI